MRNSVILMLLAIATLVIGGGIESLLPKCAGVGLPVLLTAVHFAALRRNLAAACLFAVAAGAVEDAVAWLPAMTSASYFLAFALFTGWAKMSRLAVAVAYFAYQAWLGIWVAGCGSSVMLRMLLAIPFALLAELVVGGVLSAIDRGVAIDEIG